VARGSGAIRQASIYDVVEDEQYFSKHMVNNIIKLTSSTPDTYRTIIKHFEENGIFFHTYQLKEETSLKLRQLNISEYTSTDVSPGRIMY
jgi:hypothetical protein